MGRLLQRAAALAACVFMLLAAAPLRAQPIRVAVFDPEQGTAQTRFSIDLAAYDRAADALRAAGIAVDRLTAEQIADPGVFNAERYDAVFFGGSIVPRSNIEALKRFGDAGGVPVALGDTVPFLIAVEKGPDGLWRMSPMEPRFAWQTNEVLSYFGVKVLYDTTRHDQGRRFTATPLLTRYLPDAPDPTGSFPHRWVVPVTSGGPPGEFFPLVRARRVDGADVSPQVFIARRDGRCAILCLNAVFTNAARPDLWAKSDALLVAMARIAHDLKTGQLQLSDDMRIDLPEDLPPPAPLRTRPAGEGVDPEGAAPLLRLGRFDGSSMDLDGGPLPPRLDPGQSVQIDLPALPDRPVFLRVRAAYDRTHAGLAARIGDTTLLNETYIYEEASGASNHSDNPYAGLAVEFQRLAFVPARGRTLTVSNPGAQPIHLDALQLETRDGPTPERWTGLNMGMAASYGNPSPIPVEVSGRWSLLRCNPRTQYVGPPGDPNRWDRVRRVMDAAVKSNARLNLILEGTPEWAAITPERYAEGVKAKRPHVVPPDPAKYAQIVEWLVDHYKDHVAVYELWNETDIRQFWRGTPEEYLAFAQAMIEVIERKDPGKPIMFAGLSHVDDAYLHRTRSGELARHTSLVPIHPYASESVSWLVPYGKAQGTLYAMGDPTEVYCNESGFVWRNQGWFTSGWTPQRQHDALNTALARLLAGDIAKIIVFHAGGDDHPFGLYDEHGRPRPAAAAFEAYAAISPPGARRLDAAVAPADGSVPLTGVYVAGSAFPDGSAAFVINPAESPHASRRLRLAFPTPDNAAGATPAVEVATADPPLTAPDATVTRVNGATILEITVAARTVVRIAP